MVNLCEALEEEEAAMGLESGGDQECGVERERERERKQSSFFSCGNLGVRSRHLSWLMFQRAKRSCCMEREGGRWDGESWGRIQYLQ